VPIYMTFPASNWNSSVREGRTGGRCSDRMEKAGSHLVITAHMCADISLFGGTPVVKKKMSV